MENKHKQMLKYSALIATVLCVLGTRVLRHSPGPRIALVSGNDTVLRDRVVSESTLSESTILSCPRKLLCPRSDRPWAVGHTLWASSLRPDESEDDAGCPEDMLSVRIMNFAESFIRDLAANWNSMAYSMVHPLYSSWEVIFQRLPQDFASFNETKWPLNEIEWLGMSKLSEVRDISSTISSDPSDLNMGGIGSGAAPSGAGYGGAGGYASGGAGTGGYGDAPVGSRSAWGSGGAAYGSGGSSPGYGGTAGDSVSGYGGSGAWGSGGGGAGLATGSSYGNTGDGYGRSESGYGSNSTGDGGRGSGYGSSPTGYGSSGGGGTGSGGYVGSYGDVYGSSGYADPTWRSGGTDSYSPAAAGSGGAQAEHFLQDPTESYTNGEESNYDTEGINESYPHDTEGQVVVKDSTFDQHLAGVFILIILCMRSRSSHNFGNSFWFLRL